MSDNGCGDGFFEQLSRWMDLGCEYNKTLVEETLDTLVSPSRRLEGVLDSATSLSKSLMKSGPLAAEKLLENQLDLMSKQLDLANAMIDRMAGQPAKDVIHPSPSDRRFMDADWQENAFFSYLKQSYLINSQALSNVTECLDLDDADREKVAYYLRQYSSALAPSNFPLTNPEVVRDIKQTKGKNLYKGLQQLIEDKKKSGDYLNVCMSDASKFSLGENIAATEGKVIFENSLMQLIQYKAATSHVREVPLLIVPSWINKYYILDLRAKNSFVKWAVDHGMTVYMISWVNPDASYRDVSFEDYLQQGLFTAIDLIKEHCQVDRVNTAGYCLGGILLASGLAVLAAKDDKSIASATYLAASLNFEDPGDMSVLLDDITVNGVEKMLEDQGYLDGRALSVSFCMLRENELYWNYFIQNYLKGQRPGAFDILHWNTDNTNVTAETQKFVLGQLHTDNGLMQPDAITLLGEPINLSQVKTPVYVLAAEKDHIAKWQSAYAATQVHSGSRRFVLAGSGHIAGVINPPASQKYHYYTNRALPDCPEDWLDSAFKHEGSWWKDWYRWVKRRSGELIEAREINASSVIEDAPGRYVKVRVENLNSAQVDDSPDAQSDTTEAA